MEHRRTVDNFMKYGRLGRKYYLYVFLSGMGCAGLFGGLMLYFLKGIADSLTQSGGGLPADYDHLYLAAILFFASFIVYTLIATILVVILEGRVGGSSVALVDVIDQFRIGNYKHFRELRDGDELQPVMEALKALGAALEEKK